MSEVIHCRCQKGSFSRVLGVLLEDGSFEMRGDGKSSIVSWGVVDLSCKRCGYQRELVLDSEAMALVR